jgi:glycosyltransferase involved in cell wall biosynthesis
MDISIIIPSYKEPYTDKTVDSIRHNAELTIEIIVVKDKPMRVAINEGLKQARGEFIMKCDAHCAFGKGFDRIMAEDCKDYWLMIPRRYSLDEKTWNRIKNPVDYHYFSSPIKNNYGTALWCAEWHKKNDLLIDDTMTFQGSCWFANRQYFMSHVGYLDMRYGGFPQEPLEIGMKYWLGGGEVKVNKKTWYAHLNKRAYHYDKGMFSRKYKKYKGMENDYKWSTDHWMGNHEPNMIYTFDWLINKFNPPTW